MAERILGYRLFADEEEKMNRSLVDTDGALLLVPQFTLAAETDRGMRASFSSAAPPETGRMLFEKLCAECRERHGSVETGEFGAHMQVHLINDGPVTFSPGSLVRPKRPGQSFRQDLPHDRLQMRGAGVRIGAHAVDLQAVVIVHGDGFAGHVPQDAPPASGTGTETGE